MHSELNIIQLQNFEYLDCGRTPLHDKSLQSHFDAVSSSQCAVFHQNRLETSENRVKNSNILPYLTSRFIAHYLLKLDKFNFTCE